MNKQTIILIILLISLIPANLVRADTTDVEITDINQDGYISTNFAVYTRVNNTIELRATTIGDDKHWYIEFNISSLPATAIVDRVRFRYTGMSGGNQTDIQEFESLSQPSQMADNNGNNQIIYDDAENGTSYYTNFLINVNRTRTIDLGANAVTSMNAALNASRDYWVIGAKAGGGATDIIYSEELPNPTTYRPRLYVTYHLTGDYEVNFTGLYYENGTLAGDVTVTAALVSGNDIFTVNNTSSQYYTTLPILWQYSLAGGGTRRIYAIGNESLVLTTPEDTYSTYQFTIRDYTNKLRLGTAYLEALRTINGTDTLIERVKVTTATPVPLNLVVGQVYKLRIRWGDGSYTTWGYYVTGTDTTETLAFRGYSFTDQAYTLSRFITVEAHRTAPTTITLQYNDTRLRTVWMNVTVRIRGGAVVTTSNNGNNSQTLNFGGLSATQNYIVTISGEHLDIGIWGWSAIFDATQTFPTAPDLTGVISLGGIDMSEILGYTIILACLLTFSLKFRGIGLLLTMAVTTFLNVIGWITLNNYLIWTGWLFSFVAAVLAEGKT